MGQNINPRYLSYTKEQVQEILENVEHIDPTPTDGSANPVSSGGVKDELDKKFEMPESGLPVEDIDGDVIEYEENDDPMSLIDSSSSE